MKRGPSCRQGEAVCVRCYGQPLSSKLIGPPDGPSSPDGFGLGPAPVACHGPPLVLAISASEIPGNAKAQRPSTLLEGPGSDAKAAPAKAELGLCDVENPELTELEPGHWAACHFPEVAQLF